MLFFTIKKIKILPSVILATWEAEARGLPILRPIRGPHTIQTVKQIRQEFTGALEYLNSGYIFLLKDDK